MWPVSYLRCARFLHQCLVTTSRCFGGESVLHHVPRIFTGQVRSRCSCTPCILDHSDVNLHVVVQFTHNHKPPPSITSFFHKPWRLAHASPQSPIPCGRPILARVFFTCARTFDHKTEWATYLCPQCMLSPYCPHAYSPPRSGLSLRAHHTVREDSGNRGQLKCLCALGLAPARLKHRLCYRHLTWYLSLVLSAHTMCSVGLVLMRGRPPHPSPIRTFLSGLLVALLARCQGGVDFVTVDHADRYKDTILFCWTLMTALASRRPSRSTEYILYSHGFGFITCDSKLVSVVDDTTA